MRLRTTASHDDKIELQMTPMVDIVFQLLVFFIMTFKIAAPEGDFRIKMPLDVPPSDSLDESLLPPMKLVMRADAGGELISMEMAGQAFGIEGDAFLELRDHVLAMIGDPRGPDSDAESAEVELEFDFELKYHYVIRAITAVSGFVDPEGRSVVKMIERIKFAPRQEEP